MDAFERCEAKLDRINRELSRSLLPFSEIRRSTRQIMVTMWVAMFFLPVTIFIGAMLWLGRH